MLVLRLAATASLHLQIFPWGLDAIAGESVLLRLQNTPTPDLHIFLENKIAFREKKYSFLPKRQSHIVCAQGKFVLSDQHGRLHLTLGAAQIYGSRVGTSFPCSTHVTLKCWCQCGKPVIEPLKFKLSKNSATLVTI